MENKITVNNKWKIIIIVLSIVVLVLLASVIVLLCTTQRVQTATNIHIARIVSDDTQKLEIVMPDATKHIVAGDCVEGKVKINKLSLGIDNSMYILSSKSSKIDGLPISVKIFSSDEENELQIYGWGVRFESKYYETNINLSDIIIDILEFSYQSV